MCCFGIQWPVGKAWEHLGRFSWRLLCFNSATAMPLPGSWDFNSACDRSEIVLFLAYRNVVIHRLCLLDSHGVAANYLTWRMNARRKMNMFFWRDRASSMADYDVAIGRRSVRCSNQELSWRFVSNFVDAGCCVGIWQWPGPANPSGEKTKPCLVVVATDMYLRPALASQKAKRFKDFARNQNPNSESIWPRRHVRASRFFLSHSLMLHCRSKEKLSSCRKSPAVFVVFVHKWEFVIGNSNIIHFLSYVWREPI
jgi:hypothetical protein